MLVQVLKEGPKNLSILVKGIVTEDFGPLEVLDISKLSKPSEGWKGLRLDSAVWLIQEKMTLSLWWDAHKEGDVYTTKEEDLALVMESRNSVRYDEGIPSPRITDKWPGKLYISGARNMDAVKHFTVVLDFDKQ